MNARAKIDRLGKYEVRATLGKGAMGVVYEGFDPVIERRVAIKTVRLAQASEDDAADELARFKREAQAAGRLHHPNIVGVFDYGETDDIAFIVMELVEGDTLKTLIGNGAQLRPDQVMRVMEDVLAGLSYSHARGVVHRDIKPSNVMVTHGGQSKIADFGIARIESSVMTQTGALLGTPAYMSPEQFMGQTVDARTDIYSAGVLLYQLLTGERPFDGGLTTIMHKVLNTVPPLPSELSVTAPPGLDCVVAKAMARRPEDRFQTAEAFATALRHGFTAAAPTAGIDPFGDEEHTLVARPATMAALTGATGTGVATGTATGTGTGGRSGGASAASAQPPGKRRAVLLVGCAAALVAAAAGAFLVFGTGGTPQRSVVAADTAPEPIKRTIMTPGATDTPRRDITPPMGEPPPSPPSAPAEPDRQATVVPPPATIPPATTTPVPPPPAPPQVAVPSPATIRAALTPIARLPCSLASVSVSDTGTPEITGIIGAGDPQAALRREVQAASSDARLLLQAFDGPYCRVLDVIQPYARTHGFGLVLKGAPAQLRDGEWMVPQVTAPDFASELMLDYFSTDGSVWHMWPESPQKPRALKADSVLTLTTSSNKNGWQVGSPFGTDLIVAIASSTPLFNRKRPAQERADAYLPALKAAIEAEHGKGSVISTQAILLKTVAADAPP